MCINVLLDPLGGTFGSCSGTAAHIVYFFDVHISKTCLLFFLFTMCQEITVGSGKGGKRFRPATGPLLRDRDEGIYLPT